MKLQPLLQLRWKNLGHGLKLAAPAVPVLLLVKAFLLGPQGYLAVRQRQAQYAAEVKTLRQMEAENRQLQQAVKDLKTPAAVETIARQQLQMTRPGEVVLRYPKLPAAQTASVR